jgi:hypothetical protein
MYDKMSDIPSGNPMPTNYQGQILVVPGIGISPFSGASEIIKSRRTCIEPEVKQYFIGGLFIDEFGNISLSTDDEVKYLGHTNDELQLNAIIAQEMLERK